MLAEFKTFRVQKCNLALWILRDQQHCDEAKALDVPVMDVKALQKLLMNKWYSLFWKCQHLGQLWAKNIMGILAIKVAFE